MWAQRYLGIDNLMHRCIDANNLKGFFMYEQYRGRLSGQIFDVAKTLKKIESVDELRAIGPDLEIVLSTLYEWLRDIENLVKK
jgi:hypothetical protein